MVSPMRRENMIYFAGIYTLANLFGLSVQQSGEGLNVFGGLTTSYKQNDDTATVTFKLWPSQAAVYYINCNRSASFYGQQTPAFRWDSNKLETLGSHAYIVDGSLEGGTFSFTVKRPDAQKEGWFFCKANTLRDLDIGGVAYLTRKIDPLDIVTGTTIAINQSDVILPWRYSPRKADILSVKCYYKQVTSAKWEQVYEFNRRQNSTKSMRRFTHRLTSTFTDKQFMLRIHSVQKEDEGVFDCEFNSEGRSQPFKSLCNLTATTGSPGIPNIQGQKGSRLGVSPGTIVLPIFLFILGVVCGIGIHILWIKRNQLVCRKTNNEKGTPLEMENLHEQSTTSCGERIRQRQKDSSTQQTIDEQGIEPEEEDEGVENSGKGNKKNFQEQVAVQHDGESYLLDLEDDGTLSLDYLKMTCQFATGLTKTIHVDKLENKKFIVRCVDGKLLPPRDGWGDAEYYITQSQVRPSGGGTRSRGPEPLHTLTDKKGAVPFGTTQNETVDVSSAHQSSSNPTTPTNAAVPESATTPPGHQENVNIQS